MQILTDPAMDLTAEQAKDLNLHSIPLRITLDGKTYRSGEDIQPEQFYELLEKTKSFPITSMPSSGEFAEKYREMAKTDPEILSIHVSSGLSGTLNAARLGAELVPEAKVSIIDTKTLSCPMGWQVQAAALAIKKKWDVPRIKELLNTINQHSEGMFTLPTLKYLIHGGRISHIKGLLGSLLNIKPIIGVEKVRGTYIQLGQSMTLKKSILKIIDRITQLYSEDSYLRIQPLHAINPNGVQFLKDEMSNKYKIFWESATQIAPILGAHTGPGLVGCAVGIMNDFSDVFA
jgi:DegV family protein with EDD domain